MLVFVLLAVSLRADPHLPLPGSSLTARQAVQHHVDGRAGAEGEPAAAQPDGRHHHPPCPRRPTRASTRWSLDPRDTLKGQYKLYHSALEGTLLTDPVPFEIADPIVPQPRISVEEPADVGATLHSGDPLTVKYSSEVGSRYQNLLFYL